MSDCVGCGGRQFKRLKALEELTDEEWSQEFPTFAGQRADVFATPGCESCQ